MSTGRLRETAALIRERAEAATQGPWQSYRRPTVIGITAPTRRVAHISMPNGEKAPMQPDATHIASWHPAVALAVADLLDAIDRAARLSGIAADHPEALSIRERALAVADAYLGTT